MLCRCKFWRLDLREDSQRQRIKLIANTHGGRHDDARRTATDDPTKEGELDEMDPVDITLQSESLLMTSSTQVEIESITSEELLDTQLTDHEHGMYCVYIIYTTYIYLVNVPPSPPLSLSLSSASVVCTMSNVSDGTYSTRDISVH